MFFEGGSVLTSSDLSKALPEDEKEKIEIILNNMQFGKYLWLVGKLMSRFFLN